MAYALHISHLLILGLSGTAMLAAVLMGRNPLAQVTPQVRRLTVLFLLVFWLLELVDVMEAPSSAPMLAIARALMGSAMASVASLLLLRVRQPPRD